MDRPNGKDNMKNYINLINYNQTGIFTTQRGCSKIVQISNSEIKSTNAISHFKYNVCFTNINTP